MLNPSSKTGRTLTLSLPHSLTHRGVSMARLEIELRRRLALAYLVPGTGSGGGGSGSSPEPYIPNWRGCASRESHTCVESLVVAVVRAKCLYAWSDGVR